jgi:putative hydrolase of the HAD superfamily
MQSPKVVIFDVYNTLIDINIDENNIEAYKFLSSWLSYHGFYIKPEEILSRYKDLCHGEMLANHEMYPDIDIGKVFSKMLMGIKKFDMAECAYLINEMSLLFRMLTTSHIAMYREVLPMLKAISNITKIGIASNSQSLFTLPELSKFGISQYFESIVFSSDVQAGKPNPKIFQTILKGMGVQPEDAIFIGDNIFDDVWGAKQVGMKVIWIDRGHKTRIPDGIEVPTPDVHINLTTDSYDTLTDNVIAMLSHIEQQAESCRER